MKNPEKAINCRKISKEYTYMHVDIYEVEEHIDMSVSVVLLCIIIKNKYKV